MGELENQLAPSDQKRSEQHRDRWSAHDSNAAILSLSDRLSPAEMKQFEIFEPYKDQLLETISADIAVAVWREGSVLFEEGVYLDVAFFIVSGEVDVFLDRADGGSERQDPIFDRSRTRLSDRRRRPPAIEAPSGDAPGSQSDHSEIILLSAMDFDLPRGSSVRLGPGELFGEIGALSGWPQSVTARTVSECTLVQIRMPALREMRRKSSALKKRLDAIYRERSLFARLKTTALFHGCDDAFLESFKEEVEFVSCDPGQVIVREGEAVDGLYLVRSGFVKLQRKFGEGEMVLTYLSKGMTLGEVETVVCELGTWEMTGVSVEYAELVRIPRSSLQKLIEAYPEAESQLWQTGIERIREIGVDRRNIGHSEFTQMALDTGLVQGNSILVIDLEVCTRCDDCVRACAATHGGRPRFVREGNKYHNLLIARSCYHCQDPVCLVGCPTGAIARSGVGHVVAIRDDICIGCGTCAANCPYDNIVMHDMGEIWPDDMVPEGLRGEGRLVASKCDLCEKSPQGPACVNNCPQGCAVRVDSVQAFEKLLTRDS